MTGTVSPGACPIFLGWPRRRRKRRAKLCRIPSVAFVHTSDRALQSRKDNSTQAGYLSLLPKNPKQRHKTPNRLVWTAGLKENQGFHLSKDARACKLLSKKPGPKLTGAKPNWCKVKPENWHETQLARDSTGTKPNWWKVKLVRSQTDVKRNRAVGNPLCSTALGGRIPRGIGS